jgi:MAF protein
MANGMNMSTQLFLASNSPRRRELLALGGWKYDVLNAQVDETPLPGEDGIKYVQRLAKSKAHAAAIGAGVAGVIIAADTSVIDGQSSGKVMILGKPRDRDEAMGMLRGLRGHAHQVHTAIFILNTPEGTELSDLCTTDVPMRNYSDEEIEAYVAGGDPMDKAGAYAIQHVGFHPVQKLAGCYANVMGLPLCHLTRNLLKLNIPPLANVPWACQTALEYNCPVYPQILKEKAGVILEVNDQRLSLE